MKIFNYEVSLTNEGKAPGTFSNYRDYFKEKMMQLLLIIVIYFVLFYSLSFFAKKLDHLNDITPAALQEKTSPSLR